MLFGNQKLVENGRMCVHNSSLRRVEILSSISDKVSANFFGHFKTLLINAVESGSETVLFGHSLGC